MLCYAMLCYVVLLCADLQDKCHNVADKYIEYELLLVSIDLILLREQAYRHILFNRSLLNRASVVSAEVHF